MRGKRLLLVGVLLCGWASTGCRTWCEHHVCPPAQPAACYPAACAPAACCNPCVPAAGYAPAPAAVPYNNPGCCAPAR